MVNINNIYAKAVQAIEKRNFKYAVEMLIQCVTLAPDNLEARKKLRSTARHMQKESGRKGLKIKSFSGRLKGFFSQKIKKDSEKAMVEYERSLVSNPNSTSLLNSLGQAAIEVDHFATAVWIFNDILKIEPTNTKVMTNLVTAYELNDDIHSAQNVCQKLLDVDRADGWAVRKMKNLAAKETIDRAHLEHATSFRDSLRNEQAQSDFEVKDKILRTTDDVTQAVAMTERQLAETPDSPRLLMKLGDLHKRLEHWDKAAQMYDKAYALDKADFTIKLKQGQLRIDQLAKELGSAKETYAKDKSNEEAKKKYATLHNQLISLKMEEYTKRVKAQPTNGRFHFELAGLLFQSKKHQDAIAEFQKVVNDPEFRLSSLNTLGQCFVHLKNYDLAEKQYIAALEKSNIITDRIKPVIYNLGKLYIDTGKNTEALEQLNRIYEVDINYKDVAELTNKLKEGSS